MTSAREAFYLPLMFLTVALLGGVRIGNGMALLPPPLFALVLALLLIGVLVRCGALVPQRLLNQTRRPLANLNGLVVLLTLFAAAAQAFNLAMPDAGLPRIILAVFLSILLLNTLAAAPDRISVLRSLLVIFGAAFVLKFIILAALSDPTGSRLKRVLLTLFEGLTLGTLTQDVLHPATGYLAFFTFVIFLTGLALLPAADAEATQARHRQLRGRARHELS